MSNGRSSGTPDPDVPQTKRRTEVPAPPEAPPAEPAPELPSIHDAVRRMRTLASARPGEWQQTDTRDRNVHISWLHRPEPDGRIEGATDVLSVYGHFVRPNTTTYTTVLKLLPKDLEVVDVEPRPDERYLLIELNPAQGPPQPLDPMKPPVCSRCGRIGSKRFPIVGRQQICPLCATAAA